ncbi:MAG: hypothetical protein PHY15_05090 [Eubacteriales bacterium]|nr:hypothetical protein [Eubacteriales bacterium]MDD4474470.1 hypothetical protein [Eubacteriales bacterium]
MDSTTTTPYIGQVILKRGNAFRKQGSVWGKLCSNYGTSIGQAVGFIYGDRETSIRSSGKDDIYENSDDILTTYVFDNQGRIICAYSSDLN